MAVDLSEQSDEQVFRLYDLPDVCIANALSWTSPREACRLSLVGATFRSVVESDLLWERFLPADYRDILNRSEEGLALLRSSMSRKQLYFHLCRNSVLIEGGTKSFWLDKSTGKICYLMSAKNITIIWSSTPEYWKWISLRESRFDLVAELIKVCWLEIRGTIKASMLSPNTKYAAFLVFSLKSRANGFDHPPALASVGLIGEECKLHAVRLDPDGAGTPRQWRRWFYFHQAGLEDAQQLDSEYNTPVRNAKRRLDGWLECELGEIFVEGRGEELDIDIMCRETRGGHWKHGLIVEGIEIRPKEEEGLIDTSVFMILPFIQLPESWCSVWCLVHCLLLD